MWCRDKDKDNDFAHMDKDKVKNYTIVLKDSLKTRTKTNITDNNGAIVHKTKTNMRSKKRN